MAIFATYQSNDIVEHLQQNKSYTKNEKNRYESMDLLDNSLGFNPIFVIPFDNVQDFLTLSLISFPALPQNLIIFETDNFVDIDVVTWNKIMVSPHRGIPPELFTREDWLVEYVVPAIENVRYIGNLSNVTYDTIADLFFEQIFDVIPRYACNFAKNLGFAEQRLEITDIAKISPQLQQEFHYLMHKIYNIPYNVTKSDMQRYLALIKENVFVLK